MATDPFSVLESLNLDDIPEMEVLPAGEYELKISSCEIEESKNTPGNYNIVLVMEVLDQPNSFNIFRYLSLPNANDAEKTFNSKGRFIKEAFDAFGITKADVGESAKGRTAWALLGVRTYEGREQNEVKRFITPA